MVDLHPSVKFLTVTFAALVATCLCFYLMLTLITNELTSELEITNPSQISPSIAEPREEEPVATRTKPEKIMPLQPPPDPLATTSNSEARIEIEAKRPIFGNLAEVIGPADIQLDLKAPVSDLIPVSVVQPIYPLRAAMKEIEGYVLVEFTVRENGTVSNPVIVESQPSVLFDDAALHAVSRFKFKPREVGGDTVAVENVQLKFAFTLEQLYEVEEP